MPQKKDNALSNDELSLLSFYLDAIEVQRYHRKAMNSAKEKIQEQYEQDCKKAIEDCLNREKEFKKTNNRGR